MKTRLCYGNILGVIGLGVIMKRALRILENSIVHF